MPRLVLLDEYQNAYLACVSPDEQLVSWVSRRDQLRSRCLRRAEERVEPDEIEQLITRLDSNQYEVRQAAYEQLREISFDALELLCERLPKARSREMRFRIESLVSELRRAPIESPGPICCLQFHVDPRFLISGDEQGYVALWRSSRGAIASLLHCSPRSVRSLACSPDGQLLACGGTDQLVTLWQPKARNASVQLAGHESAVQSLAFSPNGRWLASAGGFDGTIRIWDVESRTSLAARPDTDCILCVRYHPDGQQLLWCGYDSVIYCGSPFEPSRCKMLEGHQGPVRSLAVSRDGRWLVSGGNDRLVRLWDLQAGQLVNQDAWHADTIDAVDIAASGGLVVSSSRDGRTKLWRVQQEN